MNKHPDSGTLLKDIDTILSELNALCAAHDAQRATRFSPTHYEARPRTGYGPTSVKEVGHLKEKAAALPGREAHVPQPVAPITTLNVATPRTIPATVDLTAEYHMASGRFDARCTATDTITQLWDRYTAERGQCSQIVIRPCAPDDKPLSSRLDVLEMDYHSATAVLDTPQASGPQGSVRKQTVGSDRAMEKNAADTVLFSDDILPRDNAATQASVSPVDTTTQPPPCRVLMMNSRDGAEYAWPVLFPTQWTWEEAMLRAKAALSVVKAEDRLAVLDGETGISNYRHRLMDELCARGFIVPATDEGPVWD